ncbi:lysylphosphatidylglycerol synthase domain-containing protein [Goodfellowiella coeruleoviolacea]|uniref:lysylphosphatidylglycerol synthase domain-containing protein n=1 Tax=Goodfellowiella coeruleoviolacea TaxID=334858 RepID=UPI0020A34311|nr:lysylphosphatidylglycerol synthase domain-containing protein [Goodfellowiella coeruleoviolacea]
MSTTTSRPPRRRARELLSAALTVVAAAALCWWSLRGVDWPSLLDTLRRSSPALVALSVIGYTLAFCVLDVTGFTLVYRRHLAPGVPVRDVIVVVCGKLLPGLVFPLLTKVVAPVYFRRRWGVPALRTLGATEVLTVADAVVLVGVVAVGALLTDGMPAVTAPLGAVVAAVLAAFLLWAWLPSARPLFPRLRANAFLSVLVRTSPAEMLVQLALRFGLVVAMALSWWLLLLATGTPLSPGHLVQFCSVFLIATQLPISVGGYGGPQGVCVLLLSDAWGLLSQVEAVALSLLWSTAYLLSRAVVGAAFAVPVFRLLRAGGPVEPEGAARA